MGIKAADMYPGDFDGIVAGAPAVDFNDLVSWRASFYPITGASTSANFITPAQWTGLIHNEILRQCDGIDGVLDGIIEDPDLCKFDPGTLKCLGPVSASCLSDIQVGMLTKIFSPLYSEDGDLIFPAMQPGSEILTVQRLYAGIPFSYSDEWFKYVVYEPSWNASTWTVADADVADRLNPGNIRTWPSNLDDYRKRKGKIISFHGQQDNQITCFNTERFYGYLEQQCSHSDLDDYFRFFRISGMNHCSTGPGAWVFGQGGAAAAAGIPFSAGNNVLAAIVAWVENGTAPDTIEAAKFVNDTVSLGVDFTRKHCRYPLRNTYLGGDYKVASNWACE